MDATQGDLEPIAQEQADGAINDDQTFDSIEDALDALADDEDASEEPQAEETEQEPEPDAEELDDEDSVTVDLAGEKVTLKELKEGYFRQKDYTHKTTEVAAERKAVEAERAQLVERQSFVENAVQNLSAYLERLIPEEPPLSLAQRDPGDYQFRKALRENALREVGELLQMRKGIDEQRSAAEEHNLKAYRDREQSALLKAKPELADPVKKLAFDQNIRAAAKSLGFSDEEINSTHDHRILQMVELAAIGKRAIENRNNAKRRVETPKEARVAPKPPPVNVQNKKAMHALSKSGRLQDALKVDFD